MPAYQLREDPEIASAFGPLAPDAPIGPAAPNLNAADPYQTNPLISTDPTPQSFTDKWVGKLKGDPDAQDPRFSVSPKGETDDVEDLLDEQRQKQGQPPSPKKPPKFP